MIRGIGWKSLVLVSFLLAFTSTFAQRKPELHPQELFLEECADTASASTVTVDDCNRVTFTGTTTIQTLNTCSSGTDGRVLHIVCAGGAMTFDDDFDNMKLDGDFTCAVDATLTLLCDGSTTNWNELARSPQPSGGSSEWTDLGTVLHPNETGDDVSLGSATLVNSSKLSIDGDADQVQLTVQGNGTQTDSVIIVETSAGTETLNVEADGTVLTAVGLDGIGAVDMDYGSEDVTDHTFTTDGTGTAEVVLPAQSIDSTEILDSTILADDVDLTDDFAWTGIHDIGGGTLEVPNTVVGSLPAATLGRLAIVTDGSDADDCVTGGGSTQVSCMANGSTWEPTGDSGAGGSSEWTDTGTVIHPSELTDDVSLGSATLVNSSKFSIDGDADQVQMTVQGNGTQTDSVIIVETSAGTETLNVEADGTVLTAVGLDGIGAVDMDYGSEDVTDHTFTTDGTGTAEVVLPAGSIDSTEILDSTILTGDIALDTILAADIAANAVGTSEILDDTIDDIDIADNSIDATSLAANSVDGSEIVDGAVDATEVDLTDTYAWTGVHNFGGATIEIDNGTVASLPAAGTTGRVAQVTDGSTATDCTSGGGSSVNVCHDNGSAWVIVGDGVGGAGVWTDSGTTVSITTSTTDDVQLGGSLLNSSKLSIDGDADQVQFTIQGNSTQTDSVMIVETSAGTETVNIEADGTILTAVGLDAIGNVDMDYGSSDVDDHTFITDGTGTAEIVLPAGSIDSTEILDSTIAAADMADEDHGDVSWSSGVATVDTGAVLWTEIGDASTAGEVLFAETEQDLTWDSAATAGIYDGISLRFIHDATADSSTQRGLVVVRPDSTGTQTFETLAKIQNADTDGAVTTGLEFLSNTGTMTTAIEASDASIGTALSIGSNDITTGATTISSAELDILDNNIETADIVDSNVTEDKLAATLTFDDGDLLDFGTNISSATEGLMLPAHASDCSSATGEGQVCWDETGEDLYVGNGSAAIQMNSAGSSEWTQAASILHPNVSATEEVAIGGTTEAGADIFLGADGVAVFNEQQLDSDFRVEGNNADNMIFVDASDDSVGLGSTAAADSRLNIAFGTETITASAVGEYVQIAPAMTEASSGTHSYLAGVNIDTLDITGAAGATTTSANLRMGIPDSGVATNNYGFWIDDATITQAASADADDVVIEANGDTGLTILSSDTGTGTIFFGDQTTSAGRAGMDYNHNSNVFHIRAQGSNKMFLDATGWGFFDSDPDTPVEILSTTDPQFRITETEDTNFANFGVDSAGDMTIDSSGGDIDFSNENLSTTGNVSVGTNPADGGALNLANAAQLLWEDTEGTQEVGLQVDATEQLDIVASENGVGLVTTTATECVMLDASAITCDDADGCLTQVVDGTNFSYRVADFDDTTDEDGFWTFELPDNLTGSIASFQVTYTHSACTATTADGVVWDIDGDSVADDAGWNAATLGGTLASVTTTCNATGFANDLIVSAATSFTHSMNAGERAIVSINRDANNAADDVSGDARLLAVRFCYEVDNVFSGE